MVDLEEVRRIARLARLGLDTAELPHLAGELDGLLAHIDVLRELDVGTPDDAIDVPGTASTHPVPQPDVLHILPPHLAPDWREGYFTAPPSFRPAAAP